MAEATTTTTSTTAAPPAGVAADTSTAATSSATTAAPGEELFEVQTGKDQAGNPVTKKYTRAQLLEAAQRAERAEGLSQKTRKDRASLEAIAKALKDPKRIWDVIKALGHNDEELIEARVKQFVEDDALSPEQKQAKIDRAELERLRASDAQRQQATLEARAKADLQESTQKLTQTIDAALAAAKLSNTPSNQRAVARVLTALWAEKDANGQQVYPDLFQIPLDKVIAHIRTRRVRDLQELLEGVDDESAYNLVGDELLKKLGKILTKQLQKTQPNVGARITKQTDASPSKKDNGKLTPEQFREEIQRRLRG